MDCAEAGRPTSDLTQSDNAKDVKNTPRNEFLKKRNSMPFPNRMDIRKVLCPPPEPVFNPVVPVYKTQCAQKQLIGLNFLSFPNFGNKSRECSNVSNHYSLNPPPLSIYSDNNNFNLYEQFFKQKQSAPWPNNQYLNSNFEFENLQRNIGEEADQPRPIDQHSWKFSRNQLNSPFQKLRFFDDNSHLNSKLNRPNFSQVREPNPPPGQHLSVQNPFLQGAPQPARVTPQAIKVENRSHQKFSIKSSKKAAKAKKNSLIVPKTNKIFLSQISNSEKESKGLANQMLLGGIRHGGDLEPNAGLFRQRQSLPQIQSNKSRYVDSTVPDSFRSKKRALQILKKINTLNKEISCNDNFRNEINKLIVQFEEEVPN